MTRPMVRRSSAARTATHSRRRIFRVSCSVFETFVRASKAVGSVAGASSSGPSRSRANSTASPAASQSLAASFSRMAKMASAWRYRLSALIS